MTFTLHRFHQIADRLASKRQEVLDLLCDIETYQTAVHELDKSIALLNTYNEESAGLNARSPIGMLAVYLPFNTPLYSLILYCFGPILAGNTVIARPSDFTLITLSKIYSLIQLEETGLPLSLFSGTKSDFLQKYTKISNGIIFTGSWNSWSRFHESIAPQSYDTIIYCGSGRCPFIAGKAADLELTVSLAIESKLFNSGQDCLATEFFFIHSEIIEDFTSHLSKRILELSVSTENRDAPAVGPLISENNAERIVLMVSQEVPGREILIHPKRNGTLVYPALLRTTISDPILNEETFGPVFSLIEYSDFQSLLDFLTGQQYKMGASVFGEDATEVANIYPHVCAGETLISLERGFLHRPFGGRGRSGFVLVNGIFKRDGPILFSVETSAIART